MDSYLIRIYRRCKNDPEKVVGVVEDIHSGRKHPFQGMSDLSRMLTPKRFPENKPSDTTPLGGKPHPEAR